MRRSPAILPALTRRRLLLGAAATLAAPAIVRAQAGLPAGLFTLGVASGYPLPSGVALWTRLAPDPLMPGGGMPPQPVRVEWEVARDERMTEIVQRGWVPAVADWAHAVHAEVDGLEPDRWYWYRFRAGGEASPVGRTRTAPAPATMPERLRFAYASCQHYEQGWFGAYRHILAGDPDLILHLGDYIYEASWGSNHVRKFGAPEPVTLDDYRIRHALHKTDPDLQAAHAACPWLVTWDDHEVQNDYAGLRSVGLDDPDWFAQRRAAAYKAYYERMALRRFQVPLGAHMRLHTRMGFGQLAEIVMLDDRQHRSPQACAPAWRGGGTLTETCAARLDARLTMLGDAQEQWLTAVLDRSQARWNVIAQQTLMAQLDRKPGPGRAFPTDSWDGYPAARQRLIGHLARRKPGNPVVVGGDVHFFAVADLKPDFDDPASPVVASEICGTSLTSQHPWPQSRLDAMLPESPHVKLLNLERRGFVRMEIGRERALAELVAMADVTKRDSAAETLARFVVEDGKPGPQRA